MPKKQPKKPTPKTKPKAVQAKELSDEDLAQVGGGASVDYFLKLDGVPGESQQKSNLSLLEAVAATYNPIRK